MAIPWGIGSSDQQEDRLGETGYNNNNGPGQGYIHPADLKSVCAVVYSPLSLFTNRKKLISPMDGVLKNSSLS